MKTFLTAIASFGILGLVASAQQQIQLQVGDVDVKKVQTEVQQTPNFQANGPKSKNIPNPRDWLEIEVEFSVKGDGKAVVPELLFRYYVGFRDQSGSPRILTGDVKHINVVTGDKNFSAAYVAPSTLGEITGDFRRFQASAVEAVGVEIYYNGVIVGGDSSLSGSKAKFWTAGTEAGILGKSQTPFALLWLDRYSDSAPAGR